MRLKQIIISLFYLTSSLAYAIGPVQSSDVVSATGDEPLPLMKAVGSAEDDYRKNMIRVRDERAEQVKVARPDNPIPKLNLFNIVDYSKEFDTVVVINTSPDQTTKDGTPQQYMTIYRFGQKYQFPISTGQEAWACDRMKDKQGNDLKRWDQVWTGTRTGVFTFKSCDIDHRSGEFDDAKMTRACFFNGGIAVHFGNTSEPHLSHGCTRTTEEGSKMLFEWVNESGGDFDPSNAMFKAQCPPTQRISPELCQSDPKVAAQTVAFHKEAERIRANGFQQKNLLGEPLLTENKPFPSVPILNEDGTPGKDPKTGDTRRPGYRSVAIVQCIDKQGQDCSKRVQPSPVPSDQLQKHCQDIEEASARRSGRRALPPPDELVQPAPAFPNLFKGWFSGPSAVNTAPRQQQSQR